MDISLLSECQKRRFFASQLQNAINCVEYLKENKYATVDGYGLEHWEKVAKEREKALEPYKNN